MAVSITLAITQNSQSITNNTSNVTVKVTAKCTSGSYNALGTASGSITIDGKKYSFSSIKFNSSHASTWSGVVMTKTVDVSHKTDGTKTLSCSASLVTKVSSGTVSCSGSKALTTIPRKSTLSVGNGTLGTAQEMTVTKQASSFTHTITAKCGSASKTICTKSTSTSISFTPPLAWASQNTTGTSVSVTYTITTYNGDTSVGSNSYTKTCSIPSSVKPSVSIAVSDPTGYADTYGGYLKGLSKFKVVVTATPAYDSAIASYSTTANGSTYTVSSFTTGVLTSSGTLKVSSTVTDKRKRTGTASTSLTVLNYNKPSITALSVHRCDKNGTANDQGEYVKVVFSSSVTSLSSKNTAEYKLEYKKASASTYKAVTLTSYANNYAVSSGSYIFAANSGSSYNVRVTVTDKFGSGSKATTASTGFTIMHWKANGLGMGIGKISEDDDVLDVGMHLHARNGITVDSEWIDLTLNSAFNLYGSNATNQPKYKVTGNVVTIKGVVSPVTAYTSSTDKIVIASGIPSKYRPPYAIPFVCQGSGMNRWTLTVETNGNITESRYGTTAATTVPADAWLTFTVTYQV